MGAIVGHGYGLGTGMDTFILPGFWESRCIGSSVFFIGEISPKGEFFYL
jgi:hypothetical protein